jgi:hypothetical protein
MRTKLLLAGVAALLMSLPAHAASISVAGNPLSDRQKRTLSYTCCPREQRS